MAYRLKITAVYLCTLLTACGGGGGGGGDGGDSDEPRFSISRNSVAFEGIDGGDTPDAESVMGYIDGSIEDDLYIVVEISGTVVVDASVAIEDEEGELWIYPADPAELGEGTHRDTVRVHVCYDRNCASSISGSPRTINVTYVVGYDADITDSDDDGVVDAADVFPNNPAESVDTDNDGTGNNADTNDDNDGALDVADAFPLDEDETVDTDGDLIGNNADADDDGDALDDEDDPLPLNGGAPGTLTGFSPGFVIAGQSNKLLLTGVKLSGHDTVFLDGEEIPATVISPKGIEIELTPDDPGTLDISIEYAGYPGVTSTVEVPVISPVYYPYAVMSRPEIKQKTYFDPLTQALYVHNSSSQMSRYQYVPGGGWEPTALAVSDLRSIGLSHDNKTLMALKSTSLVEIDMNDFSIGQSFSINTSLLSQADRIEFDYKKTAVLKGSGSSNVLLYDLNPDSPTYGTQSRLTGFISSSPPSSTAIASSRDGRKLLFGGGNDFARLLPYHFIKDELQTVSAMIRYVGASIDASGDLLVVNNTRVYNSDFTLLGELSADPPVLDARISRRGDFIVARDFQNKLHWFDTAGISGGGPVIPDHTVALDASIGTIRDLVISDDGLTLFVMGENKMLVVPVWQITENALGSAEVCPAAGCDGIPTSAGVPAPGEEITIPPSDNEESPAEHISPTYALAGHQFEVLLTGTGFKPASVVQFDNVLAADVRYVSDTELRVMLPVLDAGDDGERVYTVTVDGHQTNAPDFTVVEQAAVVENFWALTGNFGDPSELVYQPMEHVLYGFSYLNSIYMIDLSNNEFTTEAVANVRDLTWCPEDGYLYIATGSSVQRHDPDTLEFLATVETTNVDRLECVAENKIVLTYENQFQPYKLYDIDTDTLLSTGSVYSGTVDGVSRRGDWIYFGESNISSPDRILFRPYQFLSTRLNDGGTFTSSSWSADAELGVIYNSISHIVMDESLTQVATLSTVGGAMAAAVSPDGTRIYSAIGTNINLIEVDPNNVTTLTISESRSYSEATLGVPKRIVTSQDGQTVFVLGTKGIMAVNF
jgi:hypothetical protein